MLQGVYQGWALQETLFRQYWISQGPDAHNRQLHIAAWLVMAWHGLAWPRVLSCAGWPGRLWLAWTGLGLGWVGLAWLAWAGLAWFGLA